MSWDPHTRTVSVLIPVTDNGKSHLVAEWGGTGFNFEHSRERFQTYVASAERFGDIVAKSGAGVLIANHTNLDGLKVKLPVLAPPASPARKIHG